MSAQCWPVGTERHVTRRLEIEIPGAAARLSSKSAWLSMPMLWQGASAARLADGQAWLSSRRFLPDIMSVRDVPCPSSREPGRVESGDGYEKWNEVV